MSGIGQDSSTVFGPWREAAYLVLFAVIAEKLHRLQAGCVALADKLFQTVALAIILALLLVLNHP